MVWVLLIASITLALSVVFGLLLLVALWALPEKRSRWCLH